LVVLALEERLEITDDTKTFPPAKWPGPRFSLTGKFVVENGKDEVRCPMCCSRYTMSLILWQQFDQDSVSMLFHVYCLATVASDKRERLFSEGPGVVAGMSMEKTRMDEEGWSGGRGGGELGLTGG
jgi:hypothetical protein